MARLARERAAACDIVMQDHTARRVLNKEKQSTQQPFSTSGGVQRDASEVAVTARWGSRCEGKWSRGWLGLILPRKR
jgi:hypothetical protein